MQAKGPGQWVLGFFPGGKSGRGAKLTIHVHLVPKLRMNGAILLRPSICLQRVDREDFTFYLYLSGGECSTLCFTLGDRAPDTRIADDQLSPGVSMATE